MYHAEANSSNPSSLQPAACQFVFLFYLFALLTVNFVEVHLDVGNMEKCALPMIGIREKRATALTCKHSLPI